jgi:enamine deaminase RidA (YjgF/YER057c/UK114 family)
MAAFFATTTHAARQLGRCVLVSPLFFAGLAACSAPPAEPAANPRSAAERTTTPTLSTDALGGYAPARAVRGELVALSQILPPSGEDGIVSGDLESQTGAALRILDEALAAAGLSRGDVVHLTVHVVVDEEGRIDAQGVARAWRRNFANAMQPAAPARTLVGVSALPADGARVSLTALAERRAAPVDESDDAP